MSTGSAGAAGPGGDMSPQLGGLGGGRGRSERLLASKPRGLQQALSQDSLSLKYRRMKWAVIVMATLMIIASMLLVGVSLAMAEHIDELGKCDVWGAGGLSGWGYVCVGGGRGVGVTGWGLRVITTL